jgi:hypothetical protein
VRPYPEEVVRILQTGVMSHFAPELQTNYAKAQFAFSMLLFGIAQRDCDTAVPDLVQANRELRDLLTDARSALDGLTADGADAARKALSSLPGEAKSLRLSDLRADNDALRAVIGDLAPVLEPAADVDALAALRDVRKRTYAWLSADAAKRRVPILSA